MLRHLCYDDNADLVVMVPARSVVLYAQIAQRSDIAVGESPRDLQRVVSSTPVGKRVRVVLLREGRETEVEVTIGLYKERVARERDESPKDKDAPKDGPKESPKDK